jgi:hypothetical protein
MDKKAQLGLGMILITFIAIIVGVILFQAIAQQAGSATTLSTLVNQSIGEQVNGTTYYLAGYKAISDVTMLGNGTVGVPLTSTNYTITNNVIHPTTGELTLSILPNSALYSETDWKISGTAESTTYVSNSGARAMVSLIAIFFALAVAVIALTPTLREKILG